MNIPKDAESVDIENEFTSYQKADLSYSFTIGYKRQALLFEVMDHDDYSEINATEGYDDHHVAIGKLRFPYSSLYDCDKVLKFQKTEIYGILFDIECIFKETGIVMCNFYIKNHNILPEHGFLVALIKGQASYNPDQVNHPDHGVINKMSILNLSQYPNYLDGRYISYDILKETDVKQLVQTELYYKYGNIELFGEFHVLPNEPPPRYNINQTMILPNYIKQRCLEDSELTVILESKDLEVLPVPIHGNISSIIHALDGKKYTVLAADKRYDLCIQQEDWFHVYQYIYLHTAGKKDEADKRLTKTRIQLNSDLFVITKDKIAQYIKQNYEDTEAYEHIKSYYLHTEFTDFNGFLFDKDTLTVNSAISMFMELNKLISLYSPIMDNVIMDYIIKNHSNKNIIVIAGNAHIELYIHILSKLGHKLDFQSHGKRIVDKYQGSNKILDNF